MSLQIENTGSGAPLVLIHGWGMHGGIWDNVAPLLAQSYHVHCVDLPGHGYSNPLSPTLPRRERGLEQLDAIVDALSSQFTGPLNVCGWSLGGLIALRWAQLVPQQVRQLVLVASTPCFAEREDWLFGMERETLNQFAAELERDYVATLRRFLALQVRGSENERALLADLRTRLFSHGEPDVNALRTGLEILREADLRGELAAGRSILVFYSRFIGVGCC